MAAGHEPAQANGSVIVSHRCSWPGCKVIVYDSMWGCREHWSQLPAMIRRDINHAYRNGIDTDSHPARNYLRAHGVAISWILEHAHDSVQ